MKNRKTFKITCPRCGELDGEFFEKDRKKLYHCVMHCKKCEYYWNLKTGEELIGGADICKRMNDD